MREAPSGLEKNGSSNAAPPDALLRIARVAIIVALGLLLLWLVAKILLYIFAGILLALLLRGLTEWLHKLFRLPMGWSLAAVVVAILATVAAVDYFLAPRVGHEFDELFKQIPVGLHRITQHLEQSPWGHSIVDQLQPGSGGMSARVVAGGFFGIATTTFGIIVAVIVVLFIGLYGAADPEVYLAGTLRLFPLERRVRIRQVLHEMAYALRWWLLGRLISMSVIAVMTGVGLWLIGVRLAFTLGLLAGTLSFVPYLGSISSAIPAVLIALTQSNTMVLYVIVLYVVVHVAEGYILVPLMQKKMVNLPPALTLSMQAILGTLLGVIGIALATPLTAAVMVATRMLYVEDVLHDTGTGDARER
ncbi:MAG: AI-2E family transporter [Steroidobacteraceae bacterium]